LVALLALFCAVAVFGRVRAAEPKDEPQKQRAAGAPLARGQVQEIEEEWANPDLPGFLRGQIDLSAYQSLRQENIDERRGLPFPRSREHPSPRTEAIRQMERQERILSEMREKAGLASLSWDSIGPAPIPNGQTTSIETPVNGRVAAVAVHPTNPNIVYVGAAQGGVYRTLDGGATWTAIFDTAQSLAIGAIAIAPSQPSTVYVGTGEPNLSGDSFFGVGLYRIDNADTAPVLVGPINPVPDTDILGATAFTGRAISQILVHPTDPATIFVGTASGIGGLGATAFSGTVPPLALRGLYRSTNATAALGSVAFSKLTVVSSNNVGLDTSGNVNVMDLAFEPGNPATLLAAVYGVAASDGGIYRTTNALDPTPSSVAFVQTKAIPASTRSSLAVNKIGSVVTVLAATGQLANFTGSTCISGSGRVWRSTDGGVTWETNPLPGGGGFCGGQCFYDMPVAINPADSNLIYLGGAGNGTCSRTYTRSTDGGASFAIAGVVDVGLHADAHAIAIAPSDPTIIYEGSDGGIFRSTDSGATWTSINNSGFSATQFQSIALHPSDREFMIGGTQDNGTPFRKQDGTWFRADFGDGGFARIDRNATDTENVTMYHTYFNQTNAMGFGRVDRASDAREGNWPFYGCGFVSGTNGLNCSPASSAILFYAPVELGPGNPNSVYFGSDRLFRSSDKGVTMNLVSQGPIQSGVAVSAIGISPQDDNVRLVGMRFGSVFATTTGSTTLIDVTGPWPTSAGATSQPRRFVSRAVIDPNNANTAYVTFATYCAGVVNCAQVWKTTNLDGAPATWTMASSGIPDIPVSAFVVDPRNSNNLFAGTDIGVFNSTDGGATWNPYGTGFPRVAVFELALHAPTGTLRAVTHGRGLWEIRAGLATPTFSNLSSPIILPGESPTAIGGTIKAGSLVPPGSVTIQVAGFTAGAIIQSDGSFSFSFNTSGLTPGSYPISYTYPGSPGDYASAAGAGTLTVVSSLASTTTSISAPPVTYPANAVITVTVSSSSGTPTGSVSLTVDDGPPMTQTLSGGSATFTLISPSGGFHSLVATYPRQATFEASTAAGNLVVNKATPVFNVSFPTIASGQTPSVLGGTLAAGPTAASGNVAITLDGASQGTSVNPVTAQFYSNFATGALAVGPHTLTYSYAGNLNFNAASASGTLVVTGTSTVNSFTNPAPITINDLSPATPYPSTISVSGLAGRVLKATVTLNSLTHTFVGDVGMLLVGPDGRTTALLYSPNLGANVTNATYTFDDAGPAFTGASGTFRPTQSGIVPNFPVPAPAGFYGLPMFSQNGENPNGTWSLYLEDHGPGDVGTVNGGWTLTLTTGGPTAGDFNNDGKVDILWRNQSSGDDIVWFMDGTTLNGGAVLTAVPDTNWKIGGTADFNADGKSDILWRNGASGDNVVWFMDGTTVTGGAVLMAIADTNWEIGATGDFNNDGQRDILWRNRASGDNLVWFMNGTTVSGGAVLTGIADTNWKIGGTGDFNGDGRADILWRNQATGDNVVWFMSGTLLTGGAVLTGVPDTNWRVAGIGDFNSDGKPDILWRNQATGDDIVWLMDGTTISSGAVLTPIPDTNWTVGGPR
jgi:subtilisin-like proprotein convertase family protein